MTDPVTLTAGAIATLAFQKFIESGAGELAKKFTEAGLNKMDELRQKIWAKLRGKSPKLDEALVKVEQGDRAALETVVKYLDVAMEDYPEFADEVKLLAHEITLNQIQDNSTMNQVNYGGTNFQTKIDGGTANQAQTIHQYYGSPPPAS